MSKKYKNFKQNLKNYINEDDEDYDDFYEETITYSPKAVKKLKGWDDEEDS